MNFDQAKQLLLQGNVAFWVELQGLTRQGEAFEDLVALSTLRKKAHSRGVQTPWRLGVPRRLAVLGGYSLHPLDDLLSHLLEMEGVAAKLFLGDYDNFVAEISGEGGRLYEFSPEVVILLPGVQRCRYLGSLGDPAGVVRAAVDEVVGHLLSLCNTVHQRTSAEVILGNFPLPVRHDPGAFRARTLASDWSFRKAVNLELGLKAPAFVRICDLEFLASRHGGLAAEDARAWFESKQPCSPSMLVSLCRESAHLVRGLRSPPKKVLVLDLDNTLWGGVVAEDGVEGIEIGDTSPRGEAFKAFQRYILSLKDRGVLLAVCSKNDHQRAVEPFERHPEMLLKLEDFVAFKANWEPKADNLRQIAEDLDLGLDSFVFVDDNPAEVELVRQFAPAVSTVVLSVDPADYTGQLQDGRFFEPNSITAEDRQRATQYLARAASKALLESSTDMKTYLESLAMGAAVCEFLPVDAPRLAQLINKSNQFNLTTRRRTETEVLALMESAQHVCFSLRLKDKFADHGLISVLIGQVCGEVMEIDTWLMSCRVLKRQVEDVALNELARLALSRGCTRLHGIYLCTPKNEMVRNFYHQMGFQCQKATEERGDYTLELAGFQPKSTSIQLSRKAYESSGDYREASTRVRQPVP